MKKRIDDFSYLKNLKFDSELEKTLQAKWLANLRLPLLLIFSIIVLGLVSFINLPRRLSPEINIPIVTVTTILPGANPRDVEQLITIPLEDVVKEIKGINRINSVSQEGLSNMVIQFKTGIDGNRARTEVQSAIDSVSNLPPDTQKPRVRLVDFEDRPLLNFAFVSKSDEATLMKGANKLKKTLEQLPVVDRVDLAGYENQEIEILLPPQKIVEYGINPILIGQRVNQLTNSYPAGNLYTGKSSFFLTIDKQVKDVKDLRELVLNLRGSSVKLSEIASVSERTKPDQKKIFISDFRNKPKRAVQFFVYRTTESNINQAERQVKESLKAFIENSNNQFEILFVENNAEEISNQFDDLFREFRSTILLIFLVLLVFIGLRQAVISSLTIPMTFLSAFFIMNLFNLSINFITLFALLIALGILIDDTIVIVDAMTKYYRTGKFTPLETGLLVWRDFIVPLWTTTFTTIWAFLPLLITTGVIGEFIKPIPIVITSTMLSSTIIALLVTIPLMMFLVKPKVPRRVILSLKILFFLSPLVIFFVIAPRSFLFPLLVLSSILLVLLLGLFRKDVSVLKDKILGKIKESKGIVALRKISSIADRGLIDLQPLSLLYKRTLEQIFTSSSTRKRVLFLIIGLTIFSYLLVPLRIVKSEFFPKTDQDLIYVNGALFSGANLNQVTQAMTETLLNLGKLSEALLVVAEPGTSIGNNFNRSNQSNSFLLTIKLKPKEKRQLTSIKIAQNLRDKFKNFDKAKISVIEVTGGPPSGADINLNLLGEDLTDLNQFADKVIDYLKTQKGIVNPEKSVKQGVSKIVFEPNFRKLEEANISLETIGLWLRTYVSGFNLKKIKIDDEEKEIVLRVFRETPTPNELTNLLIPTTRGAVNLSSLGNFSLRESPTIIQRENGQRVITITANVLPGFSPPEKNRELENFITKLSLPPGYSWRTGGANEENIRSVQSIIQAMIISFILILVTMVIEFKSFRKTFIALLVIPLSVSGVLYLFALFRVPLSFPALIGILALFGIVVKNAIVILDKINMNLSSGISYNRAIIEGAASRLEPIILTSLTTIFGLIPITLADPLWRGLGGAIITGLTFSGVIMLFFIPVIYSFLIKDNDLKSSKD
ncbi:MAG: efflux RND transporter permease subunit [Patescibacteria group bacterium]|nr:efflux RND transporter permease subunit [Patescibacteria group bacterium]